MIFSSKNYIFTKRRLKSSFYLKKNRDCFSVLKKEGIDKLMSYIKISYKN